MSSHVSGPGPGKEWWGYLYHLEPGCPAAGRHAAVRNHSQLDSSDSRVAQRCKVQATNVSPIERVLGPLLAGKRIRVVSGCPEKKRKREVILTLKSAQGTKSYCTTGAA